jgi:tRNA uridine 5-carbamoylmethylation protein Kti12
MTSEATVILFCGLPASGKSTLARQVEARFQEPGKCSTVHYLEYDALEDEIASDQQDPEARIRAWSQARSLALQEIEYKIREWQGSPHSLLILMDDNFHLRGMRKQVHRLLLKHKPIKFGLVWVDSSLDSCLDRNQGRQRQIPEQVISKMEATFEPPRSAWENCWIKVSDSTSIKDVIDFVSQCEAIVDLPDVVDPEKQAAERAKTNMNKRHQWDKLLRSWVGQTAKYNKQLARGANETRKSLLQKIKEPTSDIDTDSQLLDSFIDGVTSTSSSTVSLTAEQLCALKSCLLA